MSANAAPSVGDSKRTFVTAIVITFFLLLACVLGATWVFRELELEARANDAIGRARFENQKKLVRLATGVQAFRSAEGRLPASIDELRGPKAQQYLGIEPFDALYVDAWGQTFRIEPTSEGFRVVTLGRDDTPGGEGLDADLGYP